MRNTVGLRKLLFIVIVLVLSVPVAHASTITFNFNSLNDGAGNSAIQTYMRSTIKATLPSISNGVTVVGAGAEKNYTGDNHVVGPVSGTTVTPLTLGNTDNGIQHPLPWDTYIFNSNNIKIDMVFTFKIYSVSFDYEIFPNGSCTNTPTNCNVYPDFTFKADGSTILHTVALDPEAAGYTGYTHSPNSGVTKTEKAAQFLGVSQTYYFPNGVTHLEFYDWPERIGIDNLVIETTQVPEPASLVLFSVGLAGLSLVRRRRQV